MVVFDFPDATFINDFDSANLLKVEKKASYPNTESETINHKTQSTLQFKRQIDAEYDLWTARDCQGTPYDNSNRSWFYFGVKSNASGKTLLLNIVNLNRQGKLYSQGMSVIFKTVCTKKSKWERLRDRVEHKVHDGNSVLSFTFHFIDGCPSVTYFAFCYPFSYTDCQQYLNGIDARYLKREPGINCNPSSMIYYHREILCYSLDNLKVDLITISSMSSITSVREKRLDALFPDRDTPRAYAFKNKKIVFVSSRVHPGETQSSFVMNGFIEFLLRRNDPRSSVLRDAYVFKLIPMLNPDGVKRGHYRTDSRGLNLNRVYAQPDPHLHPSVFGSKSLIMYYHTTYSTEPQHPNDESKQSNISKLNRNNPKNISVKGDDQVEVECHDGSRNQSPAAKSESGLAFYIDLHGHASKRGCFMYANHLQDENEQEKCMLLPKVMSINSPTFDFAACNFSEKNMYTKDKRDGLSKEGSGRVAIYKACGIATCYTLECNYNTGRMVNAIPPATADNGRATPPPQTSYITPYTIATFEEVGRSLAISILDLLNTNPWSRIKSSEFHSLQGVQNWIRRHLSKSKKAITKNKKNEISQSKIISRRMPIMLRAKEAMQEDKEKYQSTQSMPLQSITNIQQANEEKLTMKIDDKPKIPSKKQRCQSSPFPLSCNRPVSYIKHKSATCVDTFNHANIFSFKRRNIAHYKAIRNVKDEQGFSEKLSLHTDHPQFPVLKSTSVFKTKRKIESSKTGQQTTENFVQQMNSKKTEHQLSIPILKSARPIIVKKDTNPLKPVLQKKQQTKLDILVRPDVELPTHKFPCIDKIEDDKDAVAYWVDV